MKTRTLVGAMSAVVVATSTLTVGLATVGQTHAALIDSTHARAQLLTETPATKLPPRTWLTDSAAFIVGDGDVYVSGDRTTGLAGNGSASVASTGAPTKVTLPVPAIKVVGASNDYASAGDTWLAALGSDHVIYTWGRGFGSYITGSDNLPKAITAYLTGGTGTTATAPMPAIVDIEAGENQVYALDASGNLFVWGYGNENLPNPKGAAGTPTPIIANNTTTVAGTSGCTNGAQVQWHSVWSAANGGFGVSRKGLVYGWGWDFGRANGTSGTSQLCPMLVDGANQVLFNENPSLYTNTAGTSAAGGASYADIVAATQAGPDICTGSKDAGAVPDTSGCPVRQLSGGARTARLITSNHNLYTWLSRTGTYGLPTLGRTVTADTDPSALRPGLVTAADGGSLAVDYLTGGISAVQALTTDGHVYGWGANNYCQAIGVHSLGGVPNPANTNCSNANGATVTSLTAPGLVRYPTPVAGVDTATEISATTCSFWAKTPTGSIVAFGGGRLGGTDFRSCTPKDGYKIHTLSAATPAQIFGTPVTTTSVGATIIRN